jgi:hypothetical protein
LGRTSEVHTEYLVHTVDNVLEDGTWASVQCPPIPPVPPPPTGIRHGHELVGDKRVAVGLGEAWGLGRRGRVPERNELK